MLLGQWSILEHRKSLLHGYLLVLLSERQCVHEASGRLRNMSAISGWDCDSGELYVASTFRILHIVREGSKLTFYALQLYP